MASFADDFENEIRKHVAGLKRGIEIPDGLTEDEAVAHVIAAYRDETGIEVPEADVRAEVRTKMEGRPTT